MSKYLDELTAGLDEEYLETLREAKLTVMRTRAKHKNNPEKYKLATEALNNLKRLEQEQMAEMGKK